MVGVTPGVTEDEKEKGRLESRPRIIQSETDMSEVEQALLGSVKTIFEIILSAGILQPVAIEKMLVSMRAGK